MELRDFSYLIKVQDLELEIVKFQKNIEEHNKRLAFVQSQVEKKAKSLTENTLSLEELKKKNQQHENQLQDKLLAQEKAKNHLDQASNEKQINSLQSELDSLTPEIEDLEEIILNNLEQIETKDKEIEELQGFVNGSSKTLRELSDEVEADIQKEQEQIKPLQAKQEIYLKDVPSQISQAFIKVKEELFPKVPISFAINQTCHQCKFNLGSQTQTQVDRAMSLEFCPQCSRLLISLKAKTA